MDSGTFSPVQTSPLPVSRQSHALCSPWHPRTHTPRGLSCLVPSLSVVRSGSVCGAAGPGDSRSCSRPSDVPVCWLDTVRLSTRRLADAWAVSTFYLFRSELLQTAEHRFSWPLLSMQTEIPLCCLRAFLLGTVDPLSSRIAGPRGWLLSSSPMGPAPVTVPWGSCRHLGRVSPEEVTLSSDHSLPQPHVGPLVPVPPSSRDPLLPHPDWAGAVGSPGAPLLHTTLPAVHEGSSHPVTPSSLAFPTSPPRAQETVLWAFAFPLPAPQRSPYTWPPQTSVHRPLPILLPFFCTCSFPE